MSTNIIKSAYIRSDINYDLAIEFNIYGYILVVNLKCTKIWNYNNNVIVVPTLINYSEEELFQESLLPEYSYIDINLLLELQKLGIEYIKNNTNAKFAYHQIDKFSGVKIEY